MPGQVLVTGGASGLGAAVVHAVHELGGRPLVLDKAAPTSDEVADFESVDLSDTRAAENAVRAIADRNGGLRAVVTAAGTDACGRLDEVSATDWERVVMVNLLGTAAVVRAALPYLDGGRVVTIASTLGIKAVSDATAYCASKFGVVGFTRALAAETAGRVGVTLVIPGGMRTHFFDDRAEQYRPADDSRLNPPEHVADAILFALRQPPGCEVRELVVAHSEEGSWP
ncbi:NAD(P)-dependent dehydrogenase (short-subunit alcohol dehydrogenase family) [Saccharothrix tamanrassetensis]|uniref:NAD(P)-dependent dehydrogenase (Short-subunit alcohol dehydrogenase family) n=1 Tax=Saccharothrix tamanrassetensis TaxID=1051531 RepID=A0A841CSH2_9PSEU|nr:SDR family oxidoreductase [Saccharothrix tamanrassetensis]MBB5960249.1 NAD(P)-dependent dehydrogenase (short-subunit alcohol dehydrogenase family) [Saccharothrix tamanrassetensis]